MISLVEGANRQKTPNEIALTILLAALTIVFLPVVVTLQPFGHYAGATVSVVDPRLAPGLPHPDHHRRAPLRHRHRRHGPSGAEERVGHERARGRGGGRRADAAAWTRRAPSPWATAWRRTSIPAAGHTEEEVADAAQLASLADETPEGRSIVVLAKERFNIRERELSGSARVRSVHCHHPHVGARRRRSTDPQRCGGFGAPMGGRPGGLGSRRPSGHRRPHRPGGVDAARGGRRTHDPGRHRAQGRGQGRHQGALRRIACRRASAPS